MGETDNYPGQNKNLFVMWYMLWRVLTDRHRSIKMSFLLAGRTKFSCDWCFGFVAEVETLRFYVEYVECDCIMKVMCVSV